MTIVTVQAKEKIDIVAADDRAVVKILRIPAENPETQTRKDTYGRLKILCNKEWSLKQSWQDSAGNIKSQKLWGAKKGGRINAIPDFKPGDTINIGPYSIEFKSVKGLKATFDICCSDDERITTVSVLESEESRIRAHRSERNRRIKEQFRILPLSLTPIVSN